jgi:hypothetical protein
MTQDIKSWKERRAAGCSTERAMLDEIADLHALLASQASMISSAINIADAAQERAEIAGRVLSAVAAAPASAQPADDHEFVETLKGAVKEATDDWIAGFVRQHFGIYGAQPDQRESAAVPSRRDIFGICDAYESGVGHGLQRDGHKSGAN